jgi:hypothetical protein
METIIIGQPAPRYTVRVVIQSSYTAKKDKGQAKA